MYELCAAFSLVAGAILAIPKKAWWARFVLVVFLSVQVLQVYNWVQEDLLTWVYNRPTQERGEIAQMQEIVRAAKGPVLSDEFMGFVPLAGKELPYQPFEFKQLVIAKVWDEGPFLALIREQAYDVILLYDPPNWNSQEARWTEAQLSTIYLYYQEVGRYANTIVLKPTLYK
jgi:hypothetical protein